VITGDQADDVLLRPEACGRQDLAVNL